MKETPKEDYLFAGFLFFSTMWLLAASFLS